MTDDRYEATSDHIIVTAVIKTIVKSSATEIGGELSYIEIYSIASAYQKTLHDYHVSALVMLGYQCIYGTSHH